MEGISYRERVSKFQGFNVFKDTSSCRRTPPFVDRQLSVGARLNIKAFRP
jgi:hypothetical protein